MDTNETNSFFNHRNTIDRVTEEEKEQQFSYLEIY